MKKEILRLENISKKINNVKVIKNVSFSIYEGEIVKLFGDEGQSKSILVRLLGGDLSPDFGKIFVGGSAVNITSPYVGKKLGISIIHKKSDLIPNLTVMENLFLGRSDPRIKPLFRERLQLDRSREMLKILGLDIEPQTLTSELTPEQVQMVQLGKALFDNPKVVVMDHTNIVLGQTQIKLFERVFKELKKRRVGILVVAQNLKDFTSVSDRMFIMKNGSVVGNIMTSELEKEKIAQLVIEDYFIKKPGFSINNISEEVLKVDELSTKDELKKVSFSLKKGEIISITGSYGSRKSDIGYALYGMKKMTGGRIFLDGKKIKIKSPADAIKNKIGLVSWEKDEDGLLYNLGVKENITISRLDNISNLKVIRNDLEDWLLQTVNQEMGLAFDNENMSIDDLSVADQRKINIARMMSFMPKVLILIDPTKGLDNATRKQILELLVSFSNRGVSIILISSNINEMLQISNKILLFSHNTIVGIINENELELKDQLEIFNNIV